MNVFVFWPFIQLITLKVKKAVKKKKHYPFFLDSPATSRSKFHYQRHNVLNQTKYHQKKPNYIFNVIAVCSLKMYTVFLIAARYAPTDWLRCFSLDSNISNNSYAQHFSGKVLDDKDKQHRCAFV